MPWTPYFPAMISLWGTGSRGCDLFLSISPLIPRTPEFPAKGAAVCQKAGWIELGYEGWMPLHMHKALYGVRWSCKGVKRRQAGGQD